MRFTRREIADAVHGGLHGQDGLVVGATIDSREVTPGSLFVPVIAERDGHEFIGSARRAGAGAWLTSRSPDTGAGSSDGSDDGAIEVEDTTRALQLLGSYARGRMVPSVIGVTGSSGKTSTKDLIGAVLLTAGPAAISQKSFNNELGVPLTLVNAPDDARHAVVEMGARGTGHIAMLCEIARPTVGVVTNIGTAHRELFRSAEATAHAKGELLESLPSHGVAVLNHDDAMLGTLLDRTKCRALTFSSLGDNSADLVASAVSSDDELRATFRMSTPWGSANVSLSTRGLHQVDNALAAAGASLACGIPLSDVVRGLATGSLSPWRMEFHRLANGAVILNDAYNANPSSMKAGLESLASIPAERRIAVLGTMAELGRDSARFHREVAEHVRRLAIDIAVSVDEPGYGSAVPVVVGIEGAMRRLAELGAPGKGDAILIKGSRVAGLERLAQRLLVNGESA